MSTTSRNKIAAISIIAFMLLELTACVPWLKPKKEYANHLIKLEYGQELSMDATEYFDMTHVDSKYVKDFKKNLKVVFDEEKDAEGNYPPGEYYLNIEYKGKQYRKFKVEIAATSSTNNGKLVASGELITTVGRKLSTKQLLAGFATSDGSKAKLELVKANVDYDKAGVYKISAKISGDNNALASQKVFVVDPAKNNDAYIDISITNQLLVFYKDGNVALVSEVVTGTPGTEYETPRGEYSVFNKDTDSTLIGADYVEHVDYWIGYIGHDIGIHDRQSRTEWGGDVYMRDGSHGCVNMPLDKIAILYDMVSEGMPVYVHD